MKAALCPAYGGPDIVQLRDIDRPRVRPDEYLIRVRASTVSSGDCRVRAASFPEGFGPIARMLFGFSKPRQPVLGGECAGVVEEAGAACQQFGPGDEVIAYTGGRFGCHAEYVAVRMTKAITAKPAAMTFVQAAAIGFGGLTALHFLRGPGRLQRGERVLVNGASGCVGVASIQLARHFGAHVTGVCSGAKADLVRALGADVVVDYHSSDFAKLGERWDVIFDTVGTAPFAHIRSALNPKGRLLLVAAGLPQLLLAPFQGMANGVTVAGGTAAERSEDLTLLAELCQSGSVRPVIDSTYPLEQIVEAHRRAGTGRKSGSVVVSVSE